MAKANNNGIIVTPKPGGIYYEGVVSGTPKPGTVMEISAIASDGTITWIAAGTNAANSTYYGMAADGDRIPIFILLCAQDHAACPLNQDNATAYVSGDRCAVYNPRAGEQFNMLLQDLSGTGAGEDYVVGSKLIVNNGTGKLVQSVGTPESEPFLCLEVKTDLAADYLANVMFTGF